MKITSHTKTMSKPLSDFIAIIVALSLVFLQVPLLKFAQEARADSDSAAAASTQAKSVDVGLSLDNAYITYSGQVVAAPAKKITLPAGSDLVFTATPDSGYEIASVTANLNGSKVDLAPNSNGQYKVGSGSLASGASISVRAVAIPEPVVVEEPEPVVEEEVAAEPEADVGAVADAVEGGASAQSPAPDTATAEGAEKSAASAAAKDDLSDEATQDENGEDAAQDQKDARAEAEAESAEATNAAEGDAESGFVTSSEAVAKSQPNTQSEFTYSDNQVVVTAKVSDPAALPAGVEFKVTPITPRSSAYNYDVYIDALNKSTDKEVTSDNTLLYDIAFMFNGEEIELDQGVVNISFQFKNNQLSNNLNAESGSDIEVVHLPLTDKAKRGVDSTAEATNISTSDVKVETLDAVTTVDGSNQKTEFTTDGFSAYALTAATVPAGTTADGDSVIVSFENAGSASGSAPNGTYYLLLGFDRNGTQYFAMSDALDNANTNSVAIDKFVHADYNVDVTELQAGDQLQAYVVTQIDADWQAAGILKGDSVVWGVTYYADGATTSDGWKVNISIPDSLQTAQDPTALGTQAVGEPEPADSSFYLDILGESVNFGITTGTFLLQGGDGESNVAALKATCHSQTGNDLTNQVEQTLILAEIDGEFGLKGFDAYVLTNEDDASKVISKGVRNLTIDTSYSKAELQARVQAMLDHGAAKSRELAAHEANATITYNSTAQRYILDVTDRGPGVFYVTVDDALYAQIMSDASKFKIYKSIDQTIVFNITGNAGDFRQFQINDQVSDKYKQSDAGAMPQTLVWNFINATNINIKNSVTGIILVPNGYVDVDGTSSGWLVAQSVFLDSGEWHSVYQKVRELREGSEATIKATKLINDENAEVSGFSFKLERKNGNAWEQVSTTTNNAADITFEALPFDESNFTSTGTSQDYIYRVSEVPGNVTIGGVTYRPDSSVYYAKITVKKVISVSGQQRTTTYSADTPEYFSDEACTQPLSGLPTFNNSSDSTQPETVTISGTKTWVDDENRDGKRPASITVNLLADGVEKQDVRVTPDAQGNWSYTFADLPKKQGDRDIVYTVTEDAVSEYSTEVSGYNITNTHQRETVNISGEKTWEDANNQDGIRPTSITVNLYANDTKVAEQTVVPDGQGNWSYAFTDLPKNENGSAITYTVSEEPVNGYTTTVSGYNITNTHRTDTTGVSVEKNWNDANNQDGKRVANVEVKLLANGQQAMSNGQPLKATLSASNSWKASWTDLPKNANGQPINYTVEETSVPAGYTASVTYGASAEIAGGTAAVITNTHAPEKTSVSGSKSWHDSGNADGNRPSAIQVNLMVGNAVKQTQTVTVGEDGEWSYSFDNLDAYENGLKINYTVTETPIADYEAAIADGNVVNTYKPEYTTVQVTKKWEDANNQDGKRPDRVMVQLYANGNEYGDPVAVSAAKGWTYIWENLPLRLNGAVANYTVGEVSVNGYTSSQPVQTAAGKFEITNSRTPDMTAVTVTKEWNDSNNRDGIRPASVSLQLYKEVNGTTSAVGNPATVEAAANGQWTYTWSDLPKYENGVEITYTVDELNVAAGYSKEVSGNAADGFTVKNSHENETTQVSVEKTWVDANNQDGLRPNHVNVVLKADGAQVKTATLTEDNNWAAEWTGLSKYRINKVGEEIVYTVEETAVTGYTLTSSTEGAKVTLTNTHQPETVNISGEKTWVDANNQDGIRPTSITVYLYANDTKVAEQTVVPDGQGNWSYTFTNQPKYDNGEEIVYKIDEQPVSGYEKTVSGYNLVNTHTPETVDIPVTKTWNDADNQDGARPKSITVRLYANDVEKASQAIEPDEDGNWSYTFTGLPKKNAGADIVYTVSEDAVNGYTTEVNGFNVVNTHQPETVNISGEKTWEDANNQDGKRPTFITVYLYANGQQKAEQKVEANEQGRWLYSFNNLPKYEAGNLISYSVDEQEIAEYTKAINEYDLVNSYQTETTYVSGKKTWNDENNQDGLRPNSITVRLLADGTEVDHKTVAAADQWEYSFTGLPKYKDGNVITYTVTEDAVPNYSTAISGNNITNTHQPATTSITGTKTWVDADNQDGLRPDSVTVRLFADGDEIDHQTVHKANDGSWPTFTFADLPVKKDGQTITYTLSEDPVTGYERAIGDLVADGDNYTVKITNTHTPETVEVSGKKTWNDENNQDGLRPNSITVRLLADGTEVDHKTVTAADQWEYSFTGLPKNKDGNVITYTVTEDAVPNYSTAISGYDITNTHQAEKTQVSVVKYWEDADSNGVENFDGLRATSVIVELYAGNEKVDEATLSEGNDWSAAWNNLDKYKNGQLVTYTVKEVKEGSWTNYYTASDAVLNDEGIFELVNTHRVEKVSVNGVKVWNDSNNQDGVRPSEIVVNLLANGDKVDSATVTSDDKWEFSFTDLPKYSNGQEITYTVTEDAVEGYTGKITGDAKSKFTIENSYTPEQTEVSVTKIWDDANNQDGIRPTEISVQLMNGAEVLDTQTLSEDNEWAYTWKGLDKFSNGNEIEYTVQENPEYPVANYEATLTGSRTTGFSLKNTHAPANVDVSVTKVWNDANNQDGIRLASIDVQLKATVEGEAIDIADAQMGVTLNQGNNWNYQWNNLPKMHNGKPISYTLEEIGDIDGYTKNVTSAETAATAEANARIDFTVTNTHVPDQVDIPATKQWEDANNQDGMRPTSIDVALTVNGETLQIEGAPATATLNADNNWAVTWTGLPKFANGEEIAYKVVETAVAASYDFTSAGVKDNGYKLVNKHETEKTNISVVKTWSDNNNQDGMRTASVNVQLLANGAVVKEATLDAGNNWSASWNDLDKYAGGQKITYSVVETPDSVPSGYTPSYASVESDNGITLTVTNTHEPIKIAVSGTKQWDDANNQDGIRPSSILVKLMNGDDVVRTQEVSADAEGNWSYSFAELPAYENGERITYTVAEDTISAYALTRSGDMNAGFTLKNSYKPGEVNVSVKKDWDDANNQDGVRPDSIQVQLYANGAEKGQPETLYEANQWSYTWENLPEKAAGMPISYTVKEVTENATWANDYTIAAPTGSAAEGYIIKNTHAPEETSAYVKKVWNDEDNQDGKRPDSITVQLLADDQPYGPSVILDQQRNWENTWSNLPKYQNGQKVNYSLAEISKPAGYEVSLESSEGDNGFTFTVTNTHKPETVNIPVTKTWSDNDNQDGMRPTSITVNLKKGSEVVKTAKLTPDNNWTSSFNDLPKYEAGTEIAYYVEEVSVDNYSTEITGSVAAGFEVRNSHTPLTTEIEAKKDWHDANNQDGVRPPSVSVQLVDDDGPVGEAVELNAQNSWNYKWTNLPVYRNGNKLTYEVTETAVPAEYNAEIDGTMEDGFTVTNTHAPGVKNVTVLKKWEDASNQDGLRPDSIHVQLLADGQPVDVEGVQTEVELNAGNHWTYTWSNLDEKKAGQPISYTVVETDKPDGYTAEITGSADTGYTITNTHAPELIDIPISKTWSDDSNRDGKQPEGIQVQLFADGDLKATQSVTPNDQGNWSYTFEDLPKNANGEEITYTVKELSVEGYTTEIDGFAIANTHENVTTEVKGEKTWNDNNNQDGTRPASITVILKADGQQIDQKTVTEQDQWKYEFTGLNKYRDGGIPIVYTVEEGNVAGYKGTVNNYNLVNAPIVGSLAVTKTVERAIVDADARFTFTVTLDNPNVNGQHGGMNFEGGVATFELGNGETVVADSLPAGVGYTVEEAANPAFVTTSTGEAGTIAPNTTATAAFTNTYQATGRAEFKINKDLKGRTLRAAEFKFMLSNESGAEIETISNGAFGDAAFSPIEYTLDDIGSHSYTIREIKENVPSVQYDDTVYEITVTVSDAGSGQLNVTYDGYDPQTGAEFTNYYTTSGEYAPHTTKRVEGAGNEPLEANTFEFELRDSEGNIVSTAWNDADGNVEFEAIPYTAARTYEYTIHELVPEGAVKLNGAWVFNNIAYDDSVSRVVVKMRDNLAGELVVESETYDEGTPIVFTNTRVPDAKYELKATKLMAGRGFADGDSYTFTVTGSDGAPMPERASVTIEPKSGKTAEINFGEITFTANDLNKDYSYTIQETRGGETVNGVEYDNSKPAVTLKVVDAHDGTLKVMPTYSNGAQDITFTNTYTAEGDAVLTANKAIDGRDRVLKEGEFFFKVTGDKITGRDTASNDANGLVTFDPIHFTQADVADGPKDFHYTISEVEGTLGGITYDTASYDVTVHVEDTGQGALAITYDYGQAGAPPTFRNTYETTPTSVDLVAHKALAGGKLEADQFEFTLTETTNNASTVLQTKSNDAEGMVSFDTIVYEDAGTYTYNVAEVIPQGAIDNNDGTFTGADGIVYDGKQHTVTVEVTDDGYGTLTPKVTYDDDQPGISFGNIELVRTGFEFDKYYFGGVGTFDFTMTATDAQGNARTGVAKDYSDAETIVDDGAQAFTATVHNNAFNSGVAKVVFPEVSFTADGDFYYLVAENEPSTKDMVADEAQYLVHVVVENGQVKETTYNLLYKGKNYGPTTDLSFYNNSAVKLGFSSLSTQSYTENERVSVYPKAMKYLNGSTAQLVGGDFEFQLLDEQTGEVLAVATNDETGNIAFFDEKTDPGLVYDQPGTHRYLIREVPGDITGMIYDDSVIMLTVTVTEGANGLEATTTYNGPGGAEPAFYNVQEGMDLTVQKVSRYGGEGLVDCTYALWMVGESGDVMIQEATSDASGFITFTNVNLMKGQKYYFKEVEAPAGHTVDPYRTAYFSLNETGDALVLVEETAADGWHSATENIEVDKAKASEAN